MAPSGNRTADLVVIGAGIAGLWTAAAAAAAGHAVLVLTAGDDAAAQSAAAQGIIHGGRKYALDGIERQLAAELAPMPARWRRALAGDDPVDLRAARLLAEGQVLWRPAGIAGRLAAGVTGAVLRGDSRRLAGAALPPAFRDAHPEPVVQELDEPVVDVPSVLQALQTRIGADRVRRIEPDTVALDAAADGGVATLRLHGAGGGQFVTAGRWVFAAGAGNADLLAGLGVAGPVQQLRPLHQVMVSGAPVDLFGHAVDGLSDKPRLTVTSHRSRDGERVWYLGGGLAEAGAGGPAAEVVASARALVAGLLPWLDLTGARWAAWPVDRVEGLQADGRRPDGPSVRFRGNLAVVWPTKLALAPAAADRVLAWLAEGPAPRGASTLPDGLPPAPPAVPPWDRAPAWN